MIAVNAPVSGCLNANALDFWHLRISKNFDQPEYYIGQTVLHRMKVKQGEILHPVKVVGISWTGVDWQYAVKLPREHPCFEVDDNEREWLDSHEVEPM